MCDKVLPEKNKVIFYQVLHISRPEAFHLDLRAYNLALCSDRYHQLREVRIALIILITSSDSEGVPYSRLGIPYNKASLKISLSPNQKEVEGVKIAFIHLFLRNTNIPTFRI